MAFCLSPPLRRFQKSTDANFYLLPARGSSPGLSLQSLLVSRGSKLMPWEARAGPGSPTSSLKGWHLCKGGRSPGAASGFSSPWFVCLGRAVFGTLQRPAPWDEAEGCPRLLPAALQRPLMGRRSGSRNCAAKLNK